MIKKLKVFFCLFLAVLIPLGFIACKSSSNTPQDSGGSSSLNGGTGGGNSQTPESGGSGTENPPEETPPEENPPVVNYVIDDAEMNRILEASFDTCKNFITNLNNSDLLKEKGYTSLEGGKTYPIFDYAFYPARFALQSSSDFEESKIYSHWVSTTKKFFEVSASETNDKVFATMLIDEVAVDKITAYFYEFGVTNGNIDSLRISYISTDTTYIQFSETMLDFKNSVCEIALGSVNEFSSNRTFLERNFTPEKFGLIDSMKWSYSYYQKFDFSENYELDLNVSKMPSNDDMIASLDKFGFLGVFEKLDEYRAKNNSELTNMSQDYFLYCSTNGMIVFDSENVIFEFKTEEE